MAYGVETEANTLLPALTVGLNVTIPVVNLDDVLLKLPATLTDKLYAKVLPIAITEVTTGLVDGNGVFDVLMHSISAHLASQYEKGRITGNEYTKTYIELTQTALSQATQFVLNREQTFWQSQQAQAAVITARVALETEKVKNALIRIQAETAKADFALSKMKLASEQIGYGTAKYTLESMMPQQLANLLAQGQNLAEDLLGKSYTRTQMMPQQREVLVNQNANLVEDWQAKTYTRGYILPAQMTLVTEQGNVQRAQTNNNRADGTEVLGISQAQRLLYAQQVTSYQRDAEVKAAKLYLDSWITQKTLDEGLSPPGNFTNTAIDAVFAIVRNNNGMG